MKRIVYIRTDGNNIITGGVKVNNQIADIIRNMNEVSVETLDDQYFWPNLNKSEFSPNILKTLLFNFKYLKKMDEIFKYDYIFVDSRLYPRMFIFLHRLKKVSDIRVITTHHHFCYLQQTNAIKKAIHRIIELSFLKKTDKILTFSKYTFETSKNIGLDSKKLSLDELGFDKKLINRSISSSRLNNELLFIGTVEPRKGLEYLINAISILKKEHSDVKVHIVGKYNTDSQYYQKLNRLISDKGLINNIIFHGRLSDQDIVRLKHQSSFFVFPSLYEGFGMVMAECMLYGLPVVAFNNSAIPFLVKDNINGLIANDKDSVDLSKKIKILLENKELIEQLSNGAIETANMLNSTTEFSSGIKKSIYNYIFDEEEILISNKEGC